MPLFSCCSVLSCTPPSSIVQLLVCSSIFCIWILLATTKVSIILSKYDLLNCKRCFHQACMHSAVLSLTENNLCILLDYVCLKLHLIVIFWAWFRVHWSVVHFGSGPSYTFLSCWCLCYQNIAISVVSKVSVMLETTTWNKIRVISSKTNAYYCYCSFSFKAEIRKILNEEEIEKSLINLLKIDNDGVKVAASQAISAMCENSASKRAFGLQGKWGGKGWTENLCFSFYKEHIIILQIAIVYLKVHVYNYFFQRDSPASTVAKQWQWKGKRSCSDSIS